MPSSVWAPPWEDVISKRVWHDDIWSKAKKETVWDGANWVLAWVHPVTDASLSLSKNGVVTGEQYTVTLTAPGTYPEGGFPEGAAVTFKFVGFSYTMYPTEGSNSVTLLGATHSVPGDYVWYADVQTKGGKTTFGPMTQVVGQAATSVSITGPSWVMSTNSGTGGATPTISKASFTMTLGTPSLVSKMELQLSLNNGGWTTYGTYNNPGATTVHQQAFSSKGAWRARALVTQTDGYVLYSSTISLTCYEKDLSATVSPTSSVAGETLTYTASYSGDNVAATKGRWQYLRPADNGAWHDNYSTANPLRWTPGGADDIQWRWAESFSEGSTIYSNAVRSVVAASSHYHVKVASGASRASLQSAIDAAHNWFMANKNASVNFDDENTFACVELAASGTYTLDGTSLYYRRGVRLVGAGSGSTRPLIKGSSGSHIFKGNNNGGGNYNAPHYDWLIQNIRFDCNNYTGGFSIAHVRRFMIRSCYFSNLGGKKHYIEINSSGGARDTTNNPYNCRVISCEFTMSNKSPTNGARRTEDECVQLDYSWTGAASDVANDGTVTNNVLIDGCNFHEVPRAIGSHHYEAGTGGEANPDNIHFHILVQNCTFTNVNPVTYGDGANGSGSEGAVRAYMWESVSIVNNTFNSCYQPINLYIPADAVTTHGNPDYLRIAGNILNNCSSRYGIYGTSGHSSLKFSRVIIDGNTVNGTWSTSPDIYMAGCDDTTGAVSGYSQGCVIINNRFQPSNYDAAGEKAYNKYRAQNSSNATGVYIGNNTVSDGTVDNS